MATHLLEDLLFLNISDLTSDLSSDKYSSQYVDFQIPPLGAGPIISNQNGINTFTNILVSPSNSDKFKELMLKSFLEILQMNSINYFIAEKTNVLQLLLDSFPKNSSNNQVRMSLFADFSLNFD